MPNLERVMTKLQDNGITLNYDKCEIGIPSMTYMGDILPREGLKVSEERVKAISQRSDVFLVLFRFVRRSSQHFVLLLLYNQ